MFLTVDAIRWSLGQLGKLPKNQTVLPFFLIFARASVVDKRPGGAFETEFLRYFGGYLKGGGEEVFDPFAGQWRSSGYLQSTVYGRLLAGNHRWTEGDDRFFDRAPSAGGWPASFTLTSSGFDNLRLRSSPPCLKQKYRLPLTATAIYYYRFRPLPGSVRTLDDLLVHYRNDVLFRHSRLATLFAPGASPSGPLTRDTPLSDHDMASCYPTGAADGRAKQRAFLYSDDIVRLEQLCRPGDAVADAVHRLLK